MGSIATVALWKTYHRGLCELYSISRGYRSEFFWEISPVKGISQWDAWAFLHSTRLSLWVQLQQWPSKRPITVGCVSFTAFHDDIAVGSIARKTLYKAYRRGLLELFCLFWDYSLGYYCEKNPLKGLSPWVAWDLLYSLRLGPWVLLRQHPSYKHNYHRRMCELYCIQWICHRGFYCDMNHQKELSQWVVLALLHSMRLSVCVQFRQEPQKWPITGGSVIFTVSLKVINVGSIRIITLYNAFHEAIAVGSIGTRIL
jgi:hypothetical protein